MCLCSFICVHTWALDLNEWFWNSNFAPTIVVFHPGTVVLPCTKSLHLSWGALEFPGNLTFDLGYTHMMYCVFHSFIFLHFVCWQKTKWPDLQTALYVAFTPQVLICIQDEQSRRELLGASVLWPETQAVHMWHARAGVGLGFLSLFFSLFLLFFACIHVCLFVCFLFSSFSHNLFVSVFHNKFIPQNLWFE